MAGNPILAEVSDKFGARMIRMPVGFYSLGQTSDLMQTWKAWYSLSMQAARLAWDAQAAAGTAAIRGSSHRVAKKALGVYKKRVRRNKLRLTRKLGRGS